MTHLSLKLHMSTRLTGRDMKLPQGSGLVRPLYPPHYFLFSLHTLPLFATYTHHLSSPHCQISLIPLHPSFHSMDRANMQANTQSSHSRTHTHIQSRELHHCTSLASVYQQFSLLSFLFFLLLSLVVMSCHSRE